MAKMLNISTKVSLPVQIEQHVIMIIVHLRIRHRTCVLRISNNLTLFNRKTKKEDFCVEL